MPTIWVIGSANIDFVSKVAALPGPGQTVMGGDLITSFGGKGANQAVASARLGGQVRFVGCVGQDEFGTRYRERLNAEGIDTSFLYSSRRPTGSALITVDHCGANMIVVAPGANQDMGPLYLLALRQHVKQGDILVLQMEIPLITNVHAIHLARAAGARVVLNAAPALPCDDLFDAGVDVLIINEHEAEFYAGLPGAEESALADAMRDLRQRTKEALIVTRGHLPAWLYTAELTTEVKACKVTPVDTVGAGDTFTGAIAVAMAEERPWPHALCFAHVAASLSTQRLGAQAAMPRREQVDEKFRP